MSAGRSTYEVNLIVRAQALNTSVLSTVQTLLQGIGTAATAPTKAVAGLAQGLATFGLAVNGLQAAGNALLGVSRGFIDAGSNAEGFRTSMVAIQGDVQKADKYIGDLIRFAAETPFELRGLQDQTRRLLAMGFATQDIIPLLRIAGDAVASFGGSSLQLDRVTLALSQIQTRGKVSMQELNQLSENGIGALRMLSEGYGVSTAAMSKMIEQGLVPSDKALRILMKGMQEMPGAMGAMNRQVETVAGRMSNLRDVFDQFQAGVGVALAPAIKTIIAGLGELVANITQIVVPVLQRYGPQIAEAIGPVVAKGVDLATKAITLFVGVVVGATPAIGRALSSLSSLFSTAFGAILTTVTTIGGAIYRAMQLLNPFARHSPSLVETVEGGLAAVEQSFVGLAPPVIESLNKAGNAMLAFNETVGDVSGRLGDQLPKSLSAAIALMGDGAKPAFLDLKDALEEAKGALEDQKRAVDDHVQALRPLKTAVDDAKRAVDDQQRGLKDLQIALRDARAAFEPLEERVKALRDAAKEAEEAIRDLQRVPLEGTAEFEQRIAAGTAAVREQEKALNDLKRSDTYRSLGKQIEDLERQIKDAQLAPDTNLDGLRKAVRDAQDEARRLSQVDLAKGASEGDRRGLDDRREAAANKVTNAQRALQDATEKGNDALADQRRNLELLRRRQEDLLDPAQRELENRKGNLEALRLERDARLGSAEDQIKLAAEAALGIKEQTREQILAGIAAQKAAKDTAEATLKDVLPAYDAQKDAIDGIEGQIRDQQKAVDQAQRAAEDANEVYQTQKQTVDDLQASYAAAKSEIAGFERTLRETIATARQAAQAQAQAAADKKKADAEAAKAAATAGLGPGQSIIPEGALGVTPQTQKQIDDMAASAAKFAEDVEGWRVKVENFTKRIETFFGSIKLYADAALAAVKPLAQEFAARFLPAVQRVGAMLRDNLGPALEFLKENIGPILIGIGAALAVLTGAAVVSGITALVTSFSLFGAAIVGIGVAVGVLAKAWETDWGHIRSVVEGVWAVIGPILLAIAEELLRFGAEVLPEFVKAWQSVLGFFGKLWEGIVGLFTKGADDTESVWSDLWKKLGTYVTSMFRVVGALIGGGFQILEGLFVAAAKVMQGDWEGAWGALTRHVKVAWDGISVAFLQAWDAFRSLFGTALLRFLEWGKTMAQNLIAGINGVDLVGDLGAWLQKNVIDVVITMLQMANPVNLFGLYGGQLATGFWEAISAFDMVGNLTTWVNDHIIGPVKGALGLGGGGGEGGEGGEAVMTKVGADTVQGLWDGISNQAKTFADNVGAWITTNLIAPVKTMLGVESPSTVFLEIGKDTIQGLWNGINNWAKDLLGNIQKFFVDNVITPVRSILGIPEEGQPAQVFIKVATDVINGLLKGIGDAAQGLYDKAKELGENLTASVIEGVGDIAGKLKDLFEGAAKAALDAASKILSSWKPPTLAMPSISMPGSGRGGGGVGDATDFPLAAAGNYVKPLKSYGLGQEFGRTPFAIAHPEFYGQNGIHDGIDLTAPVGTAVYAANTGKVTFSGFDRTGFGNRISIKHNGVSSLYGHLDHLAVQVGEMVTAGQQIGTVGMTGNTTGPHLHFRMDDHGSPVNPRSFMGFRRGGLIGESIVGVGASGQIYRFGEGGANERTAVIPDSAFAQSGPVRTIRGGAGGDAIDYDRLAKAITDAWNGQAIRLQVQGAEDLVVYGTVVAARRGRV